MTQEEMAREILVYRIKDNCYEVAKKSLEEHDKQIRTDSVEQYKTALKTILEEESCIHSIDLDIEASKVIDGF